jgi:hypothetical protein
MLSILVVIAVSLGLLLAFGFVGNSAARIRREHGLNVPPTAHSFVCGGDAWAHRFMDSGAASAFEMASSDLPSFLSQLKIQNIHDGDCCILPVNSRYQIRRPWTSGVALKTYRCASPTGDSLEIQIWKVDATTTGVLLYTDWN